jgi:hypothetical protein
MRYSNALTWLVCISLTMLCACTPKQLQRQPLPPIGLGELTMQDLQPCAALTPDTDTTAGSAYIARAHNDGSHVECQDKHTALAGVVWEAIRRGLIKLHEQAEGEQ